MNTPSGWYPDPNDPSQWRYWSGSAWTEHRSPRGQAVLSAPGVRAPGPRVATGNWYFIVTILSCGLLAALPFFHAASHLSRPQLRRTGFGIAAASIIGFTLIALSPTDDAGDPTGWLSSLGAVFMIAVMVVAVVLLMGIRREVYRPSVVAQPISANVGAMAGVEEARRKRQEARELASKDPMMARELGVGRPGLQVGYDDGGLLDLNLATADELSRICGLPSDLASEVVAAREALGRFLHVEDAINFGRIGEEHAVAVRDRGIVIGVQ